MTTEERALAVQDHPRAVEQSTHEPIDISIMEKLVVGGDLRQLSSAERLSYYNHLCNSLGLNPLTQPFGYLTLSGKLTLYAKRDATDQLRKIHNVSIHLGEGKQIKDVYAITAFASTADGRRDESTGVVTLGNLTGDALCNALMKCETKAKRRVTLSIVGFGWLDETEIETIPGAVIGEPVEAGAKNGQARTQAPATATDTPKRETPQDAPETGGSVEFIDQAPMASDAQIGRIKELFTSIDVQGNETKEAIKDWTGRRNANRLNLRADEADIVIDRLAVHSYLTDCGLTQAEIPAEIRARIGRPDATPMNLTAGEARNAAERFRTAYAIVTTGVSYVNVDKEIATWVQRDGATLFSATGDELEELRAMIDSANETDTEPAA